MQHKSFSKLMFGTLGKKCSVYCANRRVVILFRETCLPHSMLIHSTPSHSVSLRSILLLPSSLRQNLPTQLFHSCSPPKPSTYSSSPPYVTQPPPHIFFLYLTTRMTFGEYLGKIILKMCFILEKHATLPWCGPLGYRDFVSMVMNARIS